MTDNVQGTPANAPDGSQASTPEPEIVRGPMNMDEIVAIDMHTHAEVSCWNPFDKYGEEYDRAADKYFRSSRRPTIQESIEHYRERKIAMVMFTVDAETQLGRRRLPNEEIAEAAAKNPDILIAFGSVDPHKGKMGAREVRKLIEEHGVKGFKFHPTVQGFYPYDKMAWPLYEVINEYKLPATFHSGHSGIGSGMRCGGGLKLEYSNPMHLDDVAIAFPDMQIIIAHPSWPWQDEALSVAMHKPNVWIDLSGWSPKYFPPQLVQYANSLLKDRVLFGSDYPLITPDRWMDDFQQAGFKPDVMPLILKENAMRLLKLGKYAPT
ncbi:4-hydroxyphenyl-beta-ketoacyl-CoA hydrolase [soil metagenome]